MKDTHYEIERRFLIRYPDLCWLDTAAEKSAIVQTYLLSAEKGITERVRKRGGKEAFVYTHTTKKRISAARRIEIEEEIDEAQYRRLLQRADPARRTIEKTRYCLRENDLLFEIDVFPFWNDRAILEIELDDENQPFHIPAMIQCLREITRDKRYTNASLARAIPQDKIEEA
ncbi:MAG: hypothetical protein IKI69_07180 [Oscillospiraceae bacterium]|nr:hypothetical protein [Oscillospiraceae bacterium]